MCPMVTNVLNIGVKNTRPMIIANSIVTKKRRAIVPMTLFQKPRRLTIRLKIGCARTRKTRLIKTHMTNENSIAHGERSIS